MSQSPALFYLVIPMPSLGFGNLSQPAYGRNILEGLGVSASDAATMWNQVNTFLGHATNGFFVKLGITPTAAQVAYITNLLILLLAKIYVFYQGAFT